MAEYAALVVSVEGQGIKQTTDEIRKLGDVSEQTETSTKSLKDQTDKLVAQFVLEGQAANKTSDQVKILKLEQSGASKSQIAAAKAALDYKNRLLEQAKAADQAADEQQQLANSSNVVAGNFGAQKNSMQLVSYQLQDVAVQAQNGTSMFTILAQQGPQIASAFGPAGAAAGAVIAFGAILGGLAYSVLTARASLEELEEQVRKSGKEFNQMTAEAQALIAKMNEIRIKELEGQIRDLSREQVQLAADTGYATTLLGGQTEGLQGMADASSEAELQIQLAREEINRLTRENAGFSVSVDAVIESLREQAATAGLTGVELEIQRAKLKGANDEQLNLIRTIYAEIDAKTAAADAREETIKQLERESAERDKLIGKIEEQAGKRLESALASDDSAIERLENERDKKIALLEQDRVAALIAAEQTGAGVLAIETQYDEAIIALTQSTEERITAIKTSEARKALLEQQQADRERLESQRNVTNSLLYFENMLLQGKSETTRAAVQMGINLADAEKRENATKIISDSYSAAMAAYKALAGIPVVGPVLGAAAAGTIIAAGATYAAASLQGRATGGQVRGGQTYLVGERGPELLTMGTSGRIASNDQLKRAVGGGESIQIVNNVDARGAGPDVEQKIRQAMKQTSEMTTKNIQNLMRRRRFV